MEPAPPPPSPAAVEMFQRVCLASYPRFADAPARLRRAAPTARPVSFDAAPLWGVISGPHRVWTVADSRLALSGRYLVGVTRGEVQGRPATSCYVVDKVGFSADQARARLLPREEAQASTPPASDLPPLVQADTWLLMRGDGQNVLVRLTAVDAGRAGGPKRYAALAAFDLPVLHPLSSKAP